MFIIESFILMFLSYVPLTFVVPSSIFIFVLQLLNLLIFDKPEQMGQPYVGWLFVVLTTLLLIFSNLIGRFNHDLRSYTLILHCLNITLYIAFSSNLLLDFFISYEFVLFPMAFFIYKWGHGLSRIRAAAMMLYYTLLSSIPLLVGLIFMSNFNKFANDLDSLFTLNSLNIMLSDEHQIAFFFFIFLAFAVKLPLWPFHTWLIEAHVEAPTVGSVILAAILLKLGGIGLLYHCFLPFETAVVYYQPILVTLSLLGVLLPALTALRQTDLKRIVAYSSISHMSFTLLGLITLSSLGYEGAVTIFFAHGFVSAGLFIVIGILYDRYRTRSIFYLTGLNSNMPYLSLVLFILHLANCAFPGSLNFFGELAILNSLVYLPSDTVLILTIFTMLFTVVAPFWMISRLLFGFNNTISLLKGIDISPTIFGVLIFLGCLPFLFSIFSYL